MSSNTKKDALSVHDPGVQDRFNLFNKLFNLVNCVFALYLGWGGK